MTVAAAAPAGSSPPRTFQPELDGLRAVACISIVVFHTLIYEAFFCANGAEAMAVSNTLWFVYSFGGVDVFFLLTGYLTARPYMGSHDAVIPVGSKKRFYFNKVISRLYLPLCVLLLFCMATLKQRAFYLRQFNEEFQGFLVSMDPVLKPESLVIENLALAPFSMMFLNNLFPINFMSWTWSLGPQYHFLFAFPFILKWVGHSKRTLERVCLRALGVVMVLRLLLAMSPSVISYGFLPFLDLRVQLNDMVISNLFYNSTILRTSPFLVGMVIASRQAPAGSATTTAEERSHFHGLFHSLLAVASMVVIYLGNFGFVSTTMSMEHSYLTTLYNALIEPGGTFSALSWGYVMYAMMGRIGWFGKALHYCLSRPFWKFWATASIYIFLMHVPVILYISGNVLGPVPMGAGEYPKLLAYHAFMVVAALGGGLVFQRLCEAVVPPVTTFLDGKLFPRKQEVDKDSSKLQ